MSKWNHRCCDDCWDSLFRADRGEPVRLKDGDEGRCCWCGEDTKSGIFRRADPNDEGLSCEGAHAD